MANSALLGRKWSDLEIAKLIFDTDTRLRDWQGVNCFCIAIAESGGYEAAIRLNDHNPASVTYMSIDLGMWQMNTYYNKLPNIVHVKPADQLRHAVIPMAQPAPGKWAFNWSPWMSYVNGKTKVFASRGVVAMNAIRLQNGMPPL